MIDFQMGPLTLSVKSYADDVSSDFYEANWLNIAVKCPTDEGDVAFQSPCLMTTDLFDFMDEISDLLAGQGRQAYLVSLEPQVDVRIARGDGPDTFTLEVELTPNAEDDEDIYDAATIVTRAEVEAMVKQAEQVIEAFPVRGIQDK
ncbi:MAG: hypothetical protein ACI9PU_001044 [Ascidiaceihabitans sp.]|jgi:hypothetical protein|tara:strand:- start:6704 stop:7141 length:438 start_codon:yes stop_codon:yes gene_type:complete